MYVDEMCDDYFHADRLLKEVNSFSNAMDYIFLRAAVYALWKLTHFCRFATFVLTAMTFSCCVTVTSRFYAITIANTCAAL